MVASAGRVRAFACNVGSCHPAVLPLFSFTPSFLRGEGWGEEPTAPLISHSHTERPA